MSSWGRFTGVGFSYGIRWRLWSRTTAEAAPGARRFVAQNGFCGTKTGLRVKYVPAGCNNTL